MAASPELQQLLAMSRDRAAYQNPLFQSVTQMAYAGLPDYARKGTQLSGTLSNQAPPAQASGGMNPALAGALGGLGGAALNSLGPNGNALGALIDGIKKLLSHNSSNPYGASGVTGVGGVGGKYLPSYDPFSNDPFSGWGGEGGVNTVRDPSGGSGVGPGMQGYYEWLRNQPGQSGGSDVNGGGANNWGDWWGHE